LDRLRALDPERLLYEGTKPGPGGSGPLHLTPLQLIDRRAALVPPPRVHRHRYFGVLAPNSPLRAAVTAMTVPAVSTPAAPPRSPSAPADEPVRRRAVRYAWALLLARIYEVFPLRCPTCGGAMQIIAFITDRTTVRDILLALGEPIAPPTIAPARGPPLWAAQDDAGSDAAVSGAFPIADTLAPPAADFSFDQRISPGRRASGRVAMARRGGDSRRPRPTTRCLSGRAALPARSTRKSASAARGRWVFGARSPLDRHHQPSNTRVSVGRVAGRGCPRPAP